MISQVDLIGVVLKGLAELGLPNLNQRQFNGVIAGVDLMLEEVNRPNAPATPGMGLRAWYFCDETGLSSKYLAYCLSDEWGWPKPGCNYPHDPSDFARCVGLLDAVPELRANLSRMLDAKHGPEWNALVSVWEDLETMYREDLPSGESMRLLNRMNGLLAIARAQWE